MRAFAKPKLPVPSGRLWSAHPIPHAPLQRKSTGQRSENREPNVPPIVHEVLSSPGHPLDAETRAFMEPRFGHDFSKVRVHANDHADRSVHAVNALAYTVGGHVVFGVGQYQPDTAAGRKLLAHELTHVVQQSDGIQANLMINKPSDQYDQEADRTALAVTQE